MRYKSLAEVVEAKMAGTLEDGFCMLVGRARCVGLNSKDDRELEPIAIQQALREALTLLGLRVEE